MKLTEKIAQTQFFFRGNLSYQLISLTPRNLFLLLRQFYFKWLLWLFSYYPVELPESRHMLFTFTENPTGTKQASLRQAQNEQNLTPAEPQARVFEYYRYKFLFEINPKGLNR